VNKELLTVRSHSLPFLCLFSGIVIGIGAWPEIMRPGSPWDLIRCVAFSLYGAYSLLLLVRVALLIAVVGVAGALAFSVSGRTGEFGVRLAVGEPRNLLLRVMGEGAAMGIAGLAVGFRCPFATGRESLGRFEDAWCPVGRWVRFRVAACRRDCVSCAGRARSAGRRDESAGNRVRPDAV